MKTAQVTILITALLLTAGVAISETNEELTGQVRAAEIAFAKTMADRDLIAFSRFLAEEALFFSGPDVLRGKKAVAAGWESLFADDEAPFSWEPKTVEVLESGTLAFSSGPVWDQSKKQIATYNSIWRREADGAWKVIFDKGCQYCE